MQYARNQPAFVWRNDEGRCEENVVATDAVDAALRRISEDVFVEGGMTDALGDVLFFWKGLARGFVFYEFDAEEETKSADFAYVRVRLQRG